MNLHDVSREVSCRAVAVVTSLLVLLVVTATAVGAHGGDDGDTEAGVFMYNVTACATPCENGTFEVMSCSSSHPKLCRGMALFSILFSVCDKVLTRQQLCHNQLVHSGFV